MADPDDAAPRPRTLSTWLTEAVDDARTRDTFSRLFARELRGVECGWPRAIVGAAQAAWLRAGDVLCELSAVPLDEPFALGVTFGADVAVQLVDVLLGGHVESSLASASGAPSEAECGVLAYAAARLIAASRSAARLRDVRPAGAMVASGELVVCPASLHTSTGALPLAIWLSRARAEVLGRQRVELTLGERLPADTLGSLAVGDVLVSDDATLTQTTEGLVGPVNLRVDGQQTELRAQLRGNTVVAAGRERRSSPEQVALELASAELTSWELASLASGTPTAVSMTGTASLQHDGRALAHGELVMWRGRIGLRVTSCGGVGEER